MFHQLVANSVFLLFSVGQILYSEIMRSSQLKTAVSGNKADETEPKK